MCTSQRPLAAVCGTLNHEFQCSSTGHAMRNFIPEDAKRTMTTLDNGPCALGPRLQVRHRLGIRTHVPQPKTPAQSRSRWGKNEAD